MTIDLRKALFIFLISHDVVTLCCYFDNTRSPGCFFMPDDSFSNPLNAEITDDKVSVNDNIGLFTDINSVFDSTNVEYFKQNDADLSMILSDVTLSGLERESSSQEAKPEPTEYNINGLVMSEKGIKLTFAKPQSGDSTVGKIYFNYADDGRDLNDYDEDIKLSGKSIESYFDKYKDGFSTEHFKKDMPEIIDVFKKHGLLPGHMSHILNTHFANRDINIFVGHFMSRESGGLIFDKMQDGFWDRLKVILIQ